jgi:hypothetical protein
MNDACKSFVIKLFACCVAFAFVFMIVAMVGGFIAARLLGLPVDVDRFYGVVGPAFMMILAAVLGWLSTSSPRKPETQGEDK